MDAMTAGVSQSHNSTKTLVLHPKGVGLRVWRLVLPRVADERRMCRIQRRRCRQRG